ncbi:6135_t:CDS:2, partial [Ambispora leptoticha]
MSPRTDLCDTCQHLRNDLQFKARKEEEAQDLLKRYKEHLTRYYITALTLPLITVTAELKMSIFLIPISKLYYLSARKVHLFGVQDEAVREQINYVLDENELLGKGPNGTLSLVFDGIKQLNRGEKHLKVTCDNAGGQNKNNATIWFYLYLVIVGYYESIELNFMIPGHTKFKCDGSFGLIKRLYRKTTVDCVDHVVEVVKRSSIAGLNKARRYNGDEAQEVADGPFQEFKLLKISKSEASRVIEKIKALSFPVLEPPPMKYERQEYFYQHIRPFVKDLFKDVTCPKPS